MSIQHIISESLVEYDSVYPTIRHLIKRAYIDGYKTSNDTERTRFKFIDKETDEVIVETEVEVLAIFYDKLMVWSWAWSQTGLTNSENYLSKEILRYALTLESNLSYIKSILTTSRGVIKDLTQIDINLAIGSGIIKQPYIYPYVYPIENYNLIYFFILLNKKDLDILQEKLSKNQVDELENFDE